MLDANVNRAAEALRVLEDLARFVSGDGLLAAEAKRLRHGVRAAVAAASIDAVRMMACRDTPSDAGTANKAEDEGRRSGLGAVAIAAGNRAAEALRVVEELLKLPDLAQRGTPIGDWRAVEQIRYSGYELAKRVCLALAGQRTPQWRVCVLISRSLCLLPWQEVARRAVEGGADCLQLREKDLLGGELLDAALELRSIVSRSGKRVWIIVNDRPDIALAAAADGVHLGQGDLSVEAVRRLAGERLLVGVSTHSMAEALLAVEAGADICGVGAMFSTNTKRVPCSGPGYLRAYLSDARTARVPHLAIGGICQENVGELVAAGCRGVAVSSCVCASDRPERVCAELCRALATADASVVPAH